MRKFIILILFPILIVSCAQIQVAPLTSAVTFMVTIPYYTPSTEAIYLSTDNANPQEYSLSRINSVTWITTIELTANERVSYQYTRGIFDKAASNTHNFIASAETQVRYDAVVSWQDMSGPLSSREGFISMITMMDYPAPTVVNDFWGYDGDGTYAILDSTYDAIKNAGAGYVMFTDNPWYSQYEPLPAITTEADGQRLLTDAEITRAVNMAHDKGLKFCFVLGSMGVTQSLEAAGFDPNPWGYVGNKGATFETWWDGWFSEWQTLLVEKAKLAERQNVDMLGIGYSLGYATKSFNTSRWQSLISTIRSHYSGPLIYFETGDPTGGIPGFAGDLDYIGLDTIAITNKNDADIAELKQGLENFFDNIPSATNVIFMLGYPSLDGAGAGVSLPDIGESVEGLIEDFQEQADIYEAFFQAISDEGWVKGYESWNFAYVDDFHNYLPDPSVDPYDNFGASIRNKPASAVVYKWNAAYDPN